MMKTKIHIAIVFLAGLISVSSFAQTTSLEVNIRNVKETKGTIRVGLFINEKDFLKHAEFGKVIKAQEGQVTVVFENLVPGDYAISVVHDANENGEIDSNFFGIPTEGFGFGNNAMGTFGPPSFDKAKIAVEKNGKGTHTIDLKYF
jgi:uncharacterized protein (DUF2141 family)